MPESLRVCVYNYKGGAAKTTIVVNIAAALAHPNHGNKKTLLMDLMDRTRSLPRVHPPYCVPASLPLSHPSFLSPPLVHSRSASVEAPSLSRFPTDSETCHLHNMAACLGILPINVKLLLFARLVHAMQLLGKEDDENPDAGAVRLGRELPRLDRGDAARGASDTGVLGALDLADEDRVQDGLEDRPDDVQDEDDGKEALRRAAEVELREGADGNDQDDDH